MRAILKTLLISALLVFAGTATAAQMQGVPKGLSGNLLAAEASDLVANQGGCMTLSRAVEQVRRRYNGRIVSATTEMNGKQEVHVIKVLTEDGKVITERVPGCRRD
jgi:hypothetical protein